jgi:5-deoxy-glucuronate isomerase
MTDPISGPQRPTSGPGPILKVTPASAGWQYLSFAVHELDSSTGFSDTPDGQETAIVPLSGAGKVHVDGRVFDLSRTSVFEQKPHIVYVPPGLTFSIETDGAFTCAVGSAPAEGKLPLRLITPDDMRSEVRGGGAAHRQVVHALAPPIPAERLILYEVYVPRGTWSGWPPHCHDGRDGSPYLEETYYFRLDRPEGYALHRNWRDDEGFDEAVVAHDGDVVLVPKGYHTSVACPGSNMFFLNYLAGELVDDERSTPPCFQAEHTWIEDDWSAGEWGLPVVTS